VSKPTREDMIKCRTYGHGWEEVDIPWEVPLVDRVWRFRLSLQCTRCQTVRHDLIDVHGDVIRRDYRYLDEYRYAYDDLPTRSEFRVMLLKPRGGSSRSLQSV
jgi:hypothetical protein